VNKFIASYGGDSARAEQALKQMGMDWQGFKEYQKKMILSQSYIAMQLPQDRPITYSELIDCYNEMKDEVFTIPATIKFQLIDIEVSELEAADPNQSRLEQARGLASELMMRVRTGEDFSVLAKEYSGVSFIPFSNPVQPGSLAAPYDVLADEAEKAKPGEIPEPVEAETGEHIFIMKLEEKYTKSVEPLEDVQKRVEATIIIDRRKKVIDELNARLVRQAELASNDEFIDFCLEQIYRTCNQ
jgi:parvulin-like peptidyl-prolyl isomerase